MPAAGKVVGGGGNAIVAGDGETDDTDVAAGMPLENVPLGTAIVAVVAGDTLGAPKTGPLVTAGVGVIGSDVIGTPISTTVLSGGTATIVCAAADDTPHVVNSPAAETRETKVRSRSGT
ncbi:MAG: hypothetical protein QM775_10000 [Pirellulales bacterium]